MSTISTIQATVNPRLLTKAARLFTGSLSGRIIEILQNARRAGATTVQITNTDGVVIVRDNGSGIDDFAALLDMGGSGWEADLEASEDPAGVGLFCLAPRELTVRSRGRLVTITGSGWAGEPVEIEKDTKRLSARGGIAAGAGTEMRFMDEPWNHFVVSPQAVFSGMAVHVDGEACPQEPFIQGEAAEHPELGCRVQVLPAGKLTLQHRNLCPDSGVLVDFHGQVVGLTCWPLRSTALRFLVEMTGQPTGIRLMLPARTQLIENEALDRLKTVLEREAYLYVQRQGSHHLYYAEYLRARELGIDLPEAIPTYDVGLILGATDPMPAEVTTPDDFPLRRCYQMTKPEDDAAEINAHLLGALGKCEKPFVPVTIDARYVGYSWSKLPTIDEVALSKGELLQESRLAYGMLRCVKSLTITVRCSDGRRFASPVCMAVKAAEGNEVWRCEYDVYVTPAAQQLQSEQIWHHFGGYSDDGDTYQTQLDQFDNELEAFWTRLAGPYEMLRGKLLDSVRDLSGWQSVTITPNGQMKIIHDTGVEQVVTPPQ